MYKRLTISGIIFLLSSPEITSSIPYRRKWPGFDENMNPYSRKKQKAYKSIKKMKKIGKKRRKK